MRATGACIGLACVKRACTATSRAGGCLETALTALRRALTLAAWSRGWHSPRHAAAHTLPRAGWRLPQLVAAAHCRCTATRRLQAAARAISSTRYQPGSCLDRRPGSIGRAVGRLGQCQRRPQSLRVLRQPGSALQASRIAPLTLSAARIAGRLACALQALGRNPRHQHSKRSSRSAATRPRTSSASATSPSTAAITWSASKWMLPLLFASQFGATGTWWSSSWTWLHRCVAC